MAHSEPYYQESTLDTELIGGSVPGIARLPDGDVLAVWKSSQRVLGARSADAGVTWSRPQVLVDRVDGDVALLAAERRVVLQYTGAESTQEHAGEAPRYATSGWYHIASDDNGRSWSAATRVDTGRRYCGNCNEGIALRDGTLIMPFYYVENLEGGAQVYEREMVSVAGVLRSTDGGATWQPGAGVRLPVDPNGADEPAVVELAGGDLLMLVRTTRGRHYQARSGDHGATWSAPLPSNLIASNTPAALYRLSFEPSAVVAVWTSTPYIGAMNRYPLSVAISYDECATWAHHRILTNPGCQVSYPGVSQAGDGTILVVWQQWLAKTFTFPPTRTSRRDSSALASRRPGCGRAHRCRNMCSGASQSHGSGSTTRSRSACALPVACR